MTFGVGPGGIDVSWSLLLADWASTGDIFQSYSWYIPVRGCEFGLMSQVWLSHPVSVRLFFTPRLRQVHILLHLPLFPLVSVRTVIVIELIPSLLGP